jgi:hypothetical protein
VKSVEFVVRDRETTIKKIREAFVVFKIRGRK